MTRICATLLLLLVGLRAEAQKARNLAERGLHGEARRAVGATNANVQTLKQIRLFDLTKQRARRRRLRAAHPRTSIFQ